jgi:hypothetical protein
MASAKGFPAIGDLHSISGSVSWIGAGAHRPCSKAGGRRPAESGGMADYVSLHKAIAVAGLAGGRTSR